MWLGQDSCNLRDHPIKIHGVAQERERERDRRRESERESAPAPPITFNPLRLERYIGGQT